MSETSSDLGRAGSTGPVERDIEQAITALKKGAYLLKYGRRGKPKFCPFRLSNDESVLIWFSGKEEKHLKLSHVSRIMPGQRTPIFQRYPRPEKECQSFSLIYSDRSLDVICKDKDEAEVWFAGLKTLISRSHNRKWRSESRSDIVSSSGTTSPRTFTRRSSPLSSPFSSNDSIQKDIRSPYGSPPKIGLDKTFSDVVLYTVPPKGFFPPDSTIGSQSMSSGTSETTNGHPPRGGLPLDAFRVSLSSAVSSSSQGSGHDDGDALGDVFIWGEGTGEGILGGGSSKIGSINSNPNISKMDSFLPKPLEFTSRLDVQTVACGGRHAILVTKQGEIYSWGEESGGRLGHGVDADVAQPKLIDSLVGVNIELVACGEYHSCAVTLSGDLYTWGDGLLGHGNEVSHWVPRRINGPLEGIHVSYISCGPWHTAVVTSSGQLFTFGDGSFGVLGHGDRESVSVPREVDSLKGLRTIRASCGVWHTAAVVEVMVGNSSSSNCSSGKIFTWGDGDKGRLGHGDKETKLVPTCVAALVEPNFCQVACGHSLTVALTTSGHVYTMGSNVYGQLGNPSSDGNIPTRVEGKLLKAFVEEISCGAYHVAVLTSRTEVYTWGKGANGRLGHGDNDDRSVPTLIEALKEKQVRSVVCGTNFTSVICIHKWVSGVDQSMCSGCRLPFNFKRKRHNCYNCALVFCHSCSSKKSLRAALAPNNNKPYRVCDSCHNKLTKSAADLAEYSSFSVTRKGAGPAVITDTIEEDRIVDPSSRSNIQLSRLSSMESMKQQTIDTRSSRKNKKFEFNSSRVSPVPNSNNGSSHWTRTFNPVFGTSRKFFSASVPGSRIVSRATSPVSRRTSPPPMMRSTTPTPTLGGLASPRVIQEERERESVSQEVLTLRAQVEGLSRKTQLLEVELERTTKQLKEAIAIAGEETAKCKAAKEVIKSLTGQLKGMAERLPVGPTKTNNKLPPVAPPSISSLEALTAALIENTSNSTTTASSLASLAETTNLVLTSNGPAGPSGPQVGNGPGPASQRSSKSAGTPRNGSKISEPNHESEWVEQDEPGVYITLTTLPSGTRDLKRVRFSRKRFSEKQAEQWWQENRGRVYEQYNVRVNDKSSSSVSNDHASTH